MDFGKIIKRAGEITWRWKILWVFGFLVSLGSGGGGRSSSNWSGRGEHFEQFVEHNIPEITALIIALACVGVLIGIALWVLSVIGRGALIGGVQQVEEEGSTSLGRAWRAGVKRFWTLFGIGILTGLPIFILALIVVAAFAGPILTDIGISEGGEPSGIFLFSFLCGAPLCCLTVAAGIVLTQIQKYADRAAVLEGLGWTDAFLRGWQMLRDNIGPTLVFWLISFGIGLVLAVVVGGGMLVLALPFIAFLASADPGLWMAAPIICGGLLAMIAGAAIGSVVQTFTSSMWTLAYRQMLNPDLDASPAAEESNPA